MRPSVRALVLLAIAPLAAVTRAFAAEPESLWSANVTGYYYALRDEPDFGSGVAMLDRGSLHFELRHNYEARHATSAFVGWKFAGGDEVAWQVTPIAGALGGAVHAAIPGVEASIAYRGIDAYIEAEYVSDRGNSSDSYFYAWSELGWTPAEWLRVGLVGQRTHTVHNDRDLQRGVFAQLVFGRATLGVYAFNPDDASRYTIAALTLKF
jgi:hypothetical protein